VDLNIGGKEVTVGRDTLVKVQGSLLSEYFSGNAHLKKIQKDRVFLDRDPEIFDLILKYLRAERKWYPKDLSTDMRDQFNLEVKRWRLDYGLKSIDQLTLPEQQWRLQHLFNSDPEVNLEKSKRSLDIWRYLKPLTIDDIIYKTDQEVNFDDPDVCFKVVKKENCVVTG